MPHNLARVIAKDRGTWQSAITRTVNARFEKIQ